MKKDITGVCEETIDYYRDMLQKEDWLSEETKKMAIKKLDNMTIKAVYPEKWVDYSGLSLKGLSCAECFETIALYNSKINGERTGKKVDKDLWDFDILEANAYYYPVDNSINIILGLLGGEFYHEGQSREELLGSVGVVIGHEISHAFDTNGAQYDEKGNLKNWWTDEDMKAFEERADKLASYYSNITAFNGIKVPGQNVKTEAIADLSGIKCMLGIAADEKNFDYKKFFEKYASSWKRLNTYEYEYQNLTQDSHPLHYIRVNAALPQYEEFLKAYDIKKGDKMYLDPKDNVLVW
jgi:putative endopeptidase